MLPIYEPVDLPLTENSRMPLILLYEHADFLGWQLVNSCNIKNIGTSRNDQISSFVIISGHWQFYDDENYSKPLGQPLPPGYYRWGNPYGVLDDKVTSLKCVSL